MSGIFSQPKAPAAVPVVNPGDTANRANDALARRLAAGGTNADQVAAPGGQLSSSTSAPRLPLLAGLS